MAKLPKRFMYTVPAALGAGIAALGAQVIYAGLRRVPPLYDADPSGWYGPADAPQVKIEAVGDSALTGFGVEDPEGHWLARLANHMAGPVGFEIRCHAVTGAKTSDVIAHQLKKVKRAHVALVSAGSNDAMRGVPMDDVEERLDRIIGWLLDHVDRILLPGVGDLGATPRLPFPLDTIATARSMRAEEVHRRVAERHERVVKIPMRDLAGEAYRSWQGMYSPDMFHPTTLGHLVWAEITRPYLEDIIRDVVGVEVGSEPLLALPPHDPS